MDPRSQIPDPGLLSQRSGTRGVFASDSGCSSFPAFCHHPFVLELDTSFILMATSNLASPPLFWLRD